jgi:hypothetical protein
MSSLCQVYDARSLASLEHIRSSFKHGPWTATFDSAKDSPSRLAVKSIQPETRYDIAENGDILNVAEEFVLRRRAAAPAIAFRNQKLVVASRSLIPDSHLQCDDDFQGLFVVRGSVGIKGGDEAPPTRMALCEGDFLISSRISNHRIWNRNQEPAEVLVLGLFSREVSPKLSSPHPIL